MPSCSTMKLGLPLGERRGVGAFVWIAGTLMGVLFLVTRWCERGASITRRGAVGSVVVVTGGALATL